MVNKFQGALPKGATQKEELAFRLSGITTTKIEKKPKKEFKLPKFKLRKFPKPKGKIKFIDIKKISQSQASKNLQLRRKETAKKIIASRASPSSKTRARKVLEE